MEVSHMVRIRFAVVLAGLIVAVLVTTRPGMGWTQ
jgi:hypothetical protein